ncbi:hypothetical protein C9374_012659 [Naegleria lovaniensis]|uniref:RWP-RK domain-containing protein n=1 Tax=Naegleria lovaniensis TaxID=51637 RepID=A0AA88KQJ2_NAELO|nr:uncharacterized protein C9374_012659 [Naegleria lovaniensis]KAG2392407.1 hypothetical protein C9374_012659 [Naegleria lovaniensis]
MARPAVMFHSNDPTKELSTELVPNLLNVQPASLSSPSSSSSFSSLQSSSNSSITSLNDHSPFPSTIQKERGIKIEKKHMLEVLHMPQTQASAVLKCSLSTLKRRFYALKDEIGIETWPQFFKDIRHLKCFPQIYPMSLSFIMNSEMREEKDILAHEWKLIQNAFASNSVSCISCQPSSTWISKNQKAKKKKAFVEHKFVMSSFVNQLILPANKTVYTQR